MSRQSLLEALRFPRAQLSIGKIASGCAGKLEYFYLTPAEPLHVANP